MAKVEQAFMVSPRTSSDRHQLEKVASATPLEGQQSAGLDTASIQLVKSAFMLGHAPDMRQGLA